MMRRPDTAPPKNCSTINGAIKLRKGLWSPEEDDKLMSYMLTNGQGCWSDVARNAGLHRCGKSCRLRWINYLRPDLKRGAFSQQEEDLIIHLHSILGNRWSQIAARLPGRTDNEIKNFWNSTIKKRLKNSSSYVHSPETNRDQVMEGLSTAITENDLMFMRMDSSSSSSSSSMQALSMNSNRYGLFPFPDAGYSMAAGLANGCFDMPASIEQAGMEDDGLYDHSIAHGILNAMDGCVMEAGVCEFFVPPLESASQEENPGYPSRNIIGNSNIGNLNDHDTKDIMKGGNFVASHEMWDGHENNMRVEEWSLEDLMEDVSSFPLLDFQVE